MGHFYLSLIVASLFLVGCPDGGTIPTDWKSLNQPEVTLNTGEAVHDADVLLEHIAIVPQHIAIQVGGTVTWHNLDSVAHTVTSGFPRDPDGIIESPKFGQSESYTHQFDDPGTYVYFCATHANIMHSATIEVLAIEETNEDTPDE